MARLKNTNSSRFTGKHHSEQWKIEQSKRMIGNKNRLGMHNSEESKKKLSQAQKGNKYRVGTFHTEETKQKIRLKNIGRKLLPFTEEHKRKISESEKGKIVSEQTRQKIRINRLNQIFPQKDTSIEIKIQQALIKLNISFEKHKSLLNITQTDVFIKSEDKGIVIYADGCYWHGCEQCFDRNKIANSKQGKYILTKKSIDNLTVLKLQKEGYKVLRFWEHDINNNFEDKVLDEIIFTINENKVNSEKNA